MYVVRVLFFSKLNLLLSAVFQSKAMLIVSKFKLKLFNLRSCSFKQFYKPLNLNLELKVKYCIKTFSIVLIQRL